MITDKKAERKLLSLILCSRNDNYMGDSKWRLQTTLNYLADNLYKIGRLGDVEVIVTDWGSEKPLSEALDISLFASDVTKFLHVERELGRLLQKDSPFPEVIALNAAARRAKGKYIGRIDQDTLVGTRFLSYILNLAEGKQEFAGDPEKTLYFSNIRIIPYRFSVQCPALSDVRKYIDSRQEQFKIELDDNPKRKYFHYSVGIWMAPAKIWHECRGYDEDMIYMNGMETNVILRLIKKYELFDIGKETNYDFYHLEHYHPYSPRKSSIYRPVNRDGHLVEEPNGEDWGMNGHELAVQRAPGRPLAAEGDSRSFPERIRYARLMLVTNAWLLFDRLYLATWGRAAASLHKRRQAIRSHPSYENFRIWRKKLLRRPPATGRPGGRN